MTKKLILREVPGERPVAEVLAEIRQLYFKTTAATIDRDFDRAIDLLRSIPLPEERQRATVYMEGLAQMRKEWKRPRTERNRQKGNGGKGKREKGKGKKPTSEP